MKKSPNPAAIIGGILSIVVALSWGAVNLAYGDMLAEDAAQMIQFMLPPFLFLVLAVFLFIGKPEPESPRSLPFCCSVRCWPEALQASRPIP